MPERSASATWKNGIKDGSGNISLGSGAFEGSYSFASRFESEDGTNPEELIAGAHAGCYSMALSLELGEEGFDPDEISTEASVTIETKDEGPTITTVDLITKARVPSIDSETFQSIAEAAKDHCPVSKALAGVTITLEAELI